MALKIIVIQTHKKLFLCKHLKCHILSQAVKNDQNVYYLTYVWDGDGER